jgi:hypothetical protein
VAKLVDSPNLPDNECMFFVNTSGLNDKEEWFQTVVGKHQFIFFNDHKESNTMAVIYEFPYFFMEMGSQTKDF